MAYYIKNYSYLERLVILWLKPLELRRLCCDLIQYYKIFNISTSLNPSDYFAFYQPSLSSRASSSILIKPFKGPDYVTMFYHLISTDLLTARTRFRLH